MTACAFISNMSDKIEEPSFNLLKNYKQFEIREYEESIHARTKIIKKGWQTLSGKDNSDSFRRIASYIFGKNSQHKNIAMTAPVQISQSKDKQIMTFTMPSKYDISDLPKPNDEAVEIIVNPKITVAVLSFSGLARSRKINKLITKLQNMLEAEKIIYTENTTLALYDNPATTLHFKRRNEIWIQLDK